MQLSFTEGGTQRTFELRATATIGRTDGNDLVINHPSVSRRHARLESRDGNWWIVDLNSTNGIKVNGDAVTESAVRGGDAVSVGSVQLQVRALPSVDFSDQSMFDNPSGTVIRRISDFNSEFGLDAPEAAAPAPERARPGTDREKLFSVLLRVAQELLQSDEIDSVLETVMDMIFKHLPVERGLLILFDESGNPVPRMTRFREGADNEDIPISRTILNMVAEQQVALLTSNAIEDARLLGGKSIAIHGIRSAMCVPLWHRNRVIGAVQVDSPIHVGHFTEQDLDTLTALANFAALAIERAQLSEKIDQERRIRGKLERYHSPAVIDEIVRGDLAATADEEMRTMEVSILFADICGFTTISETKTPAEVSNFLSNFFGCAADSIFMHGGTLDKFIGDAVMAFFGAPIPQDDHADRAVRAGLTLVRLVDQWNSERAAQGLDPVRVRVGINSGAAVVGNVGTEKRVDYTVLGSSVNVASRIESGVAKPGQLVISQNTKDRLAGRYVMEELGEFSLKGLQQTMAAWRVDDDAASTDTSPTS